MECVCTLGKDVGDKCFVPQHSRIKKIARQETAPGPHKEGKSAGLSVRCLESRKPSYKLLPLSFYSTWLGDVATVSDASWGSLFEGFGSS
jgi:hypothetical protein